MRRLLLPAVLAASIALAGCGGGGGGGNLSRSEYRAKLAALSHEAAQAQATIQQGLTVKTVAGLHARLLAFAAASQRLGDEVAAIKAPENAQAANAELARGEHDSAKATRTAAAGIAKMKTTRQAIAYLQRSLGNAQGARELQDSLNKLKTLGYTSGS
jgi:hypothetical protein